MLLFIHGAGREGAPEGTFQYITCYSLSNPGMQGPVGRLWFQYITCYSLSMDAYVVMQDHIKFQYITCYSLSRSGEKTRDLADVSIHHMLLFIPRFIGILSIHMSNNTPKPKEFQYFYQALLEILYF